MVRRSFVRSLDDAEDGGDDDLDFEDDIDDDDDDQDDDQDDVASEDQKVDKTQSSPAPASKSAASPKDQPAKAKPVDSAAYRRVMALVRDSMEKIGQKITKRVGVYQIGDGSANSR